MFASIPSLVTALFIGAWTDMVGRRPALALPAIGSSIEAVIVLLTMYLKWPIYVLFVGSAINGLCGFFTTVAMARWHTSLTPQMSLTGVFVLVGV